MLFVNNIYQSTFNNQRRQYRYYRYKYSDGTWYKVLVPDLSYLVRYSTVPQCTFWYCTSTSTGTVPVTVLNNKIPYLYLVPYILLYRTALIVQVKHRRGSTQVSVPGGEELMLVARRRPVPGEHLDHLQYVPRNGTLQYYSTADLHKYLVVTIF